MKRRPVEERFWLTGKVEFTDTCWVWVAAKDRRGYGVFGLNGKTQFAHRIAYEWSSGPIPEGIHIDHICHNPSCIKPAHLRLATRKQNLENQLGAHRNSASGIRGVSWHKASQKWLAKVGHHGGVVCVGYFTDIKEAERAVIAKRNELFTHNDADRREVAA
jgi:hypothetical protein